VPHDDHDGRADNDDHDGRADNDHDDHADPVDDPVERDHHDAQDASLAMALDLAHQAFDVHHEHDDADAVDDAVRRDDDA